MHCPKGMPCAGPSMIQRINVDEYKLDIRVLKGKSPFLDITIVLVSNNYNGKGWIRTDLLPVVNLALFCKTELDAYKRIQRTMF